MSAVGRLLCRWPPDGQAVYASETASLGETWRAWSSNGGNVFVLALTPTATTSGAETEVGLVLSYSHLWSPEGPPRLSGWRGLFDAEASTHAAARVLCVLEEHEGQTQADEAAVLGDYALEWRYARGTPAMLLRSRAPGLRSLRRELRLRKQDDPFFESAHLPTKAVESEDGATGHRSNGFEPMSGG